MNVVIESALPLILSLTNDQTAGRIAFVSHRIGKVVESILAGMVLSRLASQFISEIGKRQSTCLGLGMGCVFATIFLWNEAESSKQGIEKSTPGNGVIGFMMNLTVKGLNTAGVIQLFTDKKWSDVSPHKIGAGFCLLSSSFTLLTEMAKYFATSN